MGGVSLLDKIKERSGAPLAPERPTWDADLLVEVDDSPRPRTPEDDEIDKLISSVTIVDAYRRWCGKMEPKVGKRAESIMVSCPNPAHPDKHPSAWMNSEKGVGNCAVCGGFDVYDIAAWGLGFAVPEYKQGETFPALRKAIAEQLGYVVKRTPSGTEYVERPEPPATESAVLPVAPAVEEQPEAEAASPPASNETPVAHVLTIVPAGEEEEEAPSIDWRDLLPADTFMARWMDVTSVDDLPEEYYFWEGLMACGFAAGNDVVLLDRPPVKPNLFVCLYGPSGIGKTRSTQALTELLERALPYSHEDESLGTYLTPSPGSAEALVDAFSKRELSDDDGTETGRFLPVRGLVRFDELSNLIGKANRNGSTMKPTLMELFDGYRPIEMRSRGAGYVRAEDYYCSALTTTQPGAIRDLLMQTDADSGFINRWVFASGPLKQLIDYGREPLDIQRLVIPLVQLQQWSHTGHHLRLEGKAREVWKSFFDSTIAPVRTSEEASLLTRCDLILKKCIALFCVNERLETPSAELVERVIKLFPYLRKTYSMLISEIGIGSFEDCRETVGKVIRKVETDTGRPVSIRDINRLLPRRYPRDQLTKVLAVMVTLSEIDENIEKGKRGPATVRYSYCA